MQADTHTLFEYPLGKPLEAKLRKESFGTHSRSDVNITARVNGISYRMILKHDTCKLRQRRRLLQREARNHCFEGNKATGAAAARPKTAIITA